MDFDPDERADSVCTDLPEPPVGPDPRFQPAPQDTLPPPIVVQRYPPEPPSPPTQLQQDCLDPDPQQRLIVVLHHGHHLRAPIRPWPPATRRRDTILRNRREEPGRWEPEDVGLTDWSALLGNGQWIWGYTL